MSVAIDAPMSTPKAMKRTKGGTRHHTMDQHRHDPLWTFPLPHPCLNLRSFPKTYHHIKESRRQMSRSIMRKKGVQQAMQKAVHTRMAHSQT